MGNNQFDSMINQAAQKLGISPDALKAAINDPKKADSMLGEINKKTNGELNTQNAKAMKDMLNKNPQAKQMFNNLTKGGKNG